MLSSDSGAQLAFEGLLYLAHGGLNLLVGEGLLLVLQDEADGIRLEAFGDTFAFVDVCSLVALIWHSTGGPVNFQMGHF